MGGGEDIRDARHVKFAFHFPKHLLGALLLPVLHLLSQYAMVVQDDPCAPIPSSRLQKTPWQIKSAVDEDDIWLYFQDCRVIGINDRHVCCPHFLDRGRGFNRIRDRGISDLFCDEAETTGRLELRGRSTLDCSWQNDIYTKNIKSGRAPSFVVEGKVR